MAGWDRDAGIGWYHARHMVPNRSRGRWVAIDFRMNGYISQAASYVWIRIATSAVVFDRPILRFVLLAACGASSGRVVAAENSGMR